MQIDPTKSGLQNLLLLVDAKNAGGPSNPAQVTFTNLQPATIDGDEVTNTSVELEGVAGQGFSGSQTYTYGRLSLASEAANPVGPVPIPNGTTDVLGAVAAFFGFIVADISFTVAPVAPGSLPGTTTNTLQASGSLVYLDGTVDVELNWEA